jgi:uncharacterized SAM-binding protein YcdF (DUF218 family)
MMDLSALKPLLTSLALPPLAPLLLAALGLLLAAGKKRGGLALTALSLAVLALLSCHGAAVWLARHALPQFAPASVAQLKTGQVQAIVVLGGGLLPEAPEYGQAQPAPHTAARLLSGLSLPRQSGSPVAFTGGVGWAAQGAQAASEAEVAARVGQQDYGVTLRWLEAQSQDTAGNARLLAPLLQRDGVQRIALVTDAWHMPRAVALFERAGLQVTPAPMGFVRPIEGPVLQWLPSARGLLASQQVLREWLALAVGRLLPA